IHALQILKFTEEPAMSYVDGYVLPVPEKNLPAYQKLAKQAGKIWREHGALDYRESAGEDLQIQGVGSFAKLLKLKPGETVIFAYVLFKSRKHRDQVNKKVMQDPRLKCDPNNMPFDFKRMFYSGFKTIAEA